MHFSWKQLTKFLQNIMEILEIIKDICIIRFAGNVYMNLITSSSKILKPFLRLLIILSDYNMIQNCKSLILIIVSNICIYFYYLRRIGNLQYIYTKILLQEHTYSYGKAFQKHSHLSNSSMLFTDPIQSKQFSLFDPYKDTIQPDDNEREISTANKSEFGVLKYSQKEQQDRQCKSCRYNLSDESYFGELPCQMMPVSDQYQINHQEQGSHDEEQDRGSRKRSNIGPRQRRKRRRADAEPQAGVQGEQNYIIRRGGKMVGKYLQKISEASQYKCNKKKCEQNSGQYFRGNIGCNTNCECMNCANLAYCSSQKKAQKPINVREKLKKKDKSQKLKGSCQCKKTNCIKNYCQCYHGGKSCGEFCSCIGCQNQQP